MRAAACSARCSARVRTGEVGVVAWPLGDTSGRPAGAGAGASAGVGVEGAAEL